MEVQEMEKKNSQRLSAMEKRLEDVLQSNMQLQAMLRTVLNTVSPDVVKDIRDIPPSESPGVEEQPDTEQKNNCTGAMNSTGLVNSECWWDNVCKSSDEERDVGAKGRERVSMNSTTQHLLC